MDKTALTYISQLDLERNRVKAVENFKRYGHSRMCAMPKSGLWAFISRTIGEVLSNYDIYSQGFHYFETLHETHS